MKKTNSVQYKIILDLEKLNALNSRGCPGCGGKFNLGDSVVLAQGSWDGGPEFIHEREAVFDSRTARYYERAWFTGVHQG